MKIVITGNMGYVGPRVVRHLRAIHPSARLIGIDVGWFGTLLTNAATLPETLLDAQHYCDVRDVPAEVLDGADAVVHLAGVSNDPIGNEFSDITSDINVGGTIELARRARNAGVRSFVFASSCSVYGHAEEGARSEASVVHPLTAYARSKIAAEKELETLASSDFVVTSLRFATACGMSERLRLDLVLNQFVAYALATRKVVVLSDGTPWRPLIDVDDMARAIEWAAFRDRAAGGNCLVVNAGRNDANYSVRQIATAVAEAVEGSSVTINEAAAPDLRSYRVDFSLFARLAPAHQPLRTLNDSIASVRQGLEAMGWNDPDVQHCAYIRLETLRRLRTEGALSRELQWQDRGAGVSS